MSINSYILRPQCRHGGSALRLALAHLEQPAAAAALSPLSGLAAQGTGAAFALLNIAEGVSRVHASRRVFDILRSHEDTTSVIHHRSFPEGTLPGHLWSALSELCQGPLQQQRNHAATITLALQAARGLMSFMSVWLAASGQSVLPGGSSCQHQSLRSTVPIHSTGLLKA